jgi:hypothetical protein
MFRWVTQFTQRSVRRAIGAVIGQTGGNTQTKNFLTTSGDPAMQIKPPSATQAAATPQPARTAAAGKGSDFSQMLKSAQAEAPAATPATTAAAAPAKG